MYRDIKMHSLFINNPIETYLKYYYLSLCGFEILPKIWMWTVDSPKISGGTFASSENFNRKLHKKLFYMYLYVRGSNCPPPSVLSGFKFRGKILFFQEGS